MMVLMLKYAKLYPDIFEMDIADLTELLVGNIEESKEECLQDVGLLFSRVGQLRRAVHAHVYPQRDLFPVEQFRGYTHVEIETMGGDNVVIENLGIHDACIFDCRHLPDPVFEYPLIERKGMEKRMRDMLFSRTDYTNFFNYVVATVRKEVLFPPAYEPWETYTPEEPLIRAPVKRIVFVCFAGQHRSVAFAEKLGEYFEERVPFLIYSIQHTSIGNAKRFYYPSFTPNYVKQLL